MITTLFGEGQNYRRLSRARTTLVGSSSLWEGADHFVQIEVVAFSETHKRFYFQDVKAFTLRRTRRGLWLHLLFGLFTVAAAAIAIWTFASGHSAGGVLDWLTVAVPSGFALGWLTHLALGPTCACHVMTPVQNTRLGALTRTRRARKVLEYLAQRAQTSQGGVVGMEPQDQRQLASAVSPVLGAAASEQKLAAGSSRLYPVVSFLSLLNAAFLFGLLVWDSYPLRAVQVLFTVGLLALGITCAVRSRRSTGDLAAWFKWIGWALFSANGLIFLLWYGYGVYRAGAARPRVPGLELNYVQEMLQISPQGSRFWFWVVIVDACFSMFVGVVGLLVIVLGRAGRHEQGGVKTEESL